MNILNQEEFNTKILIRVPSGKTKEECKPEEIEEGYQIRGQFIPVKELLKFYYQNKRII